LVNQETVSDLDGLLLSSNPDTTSTKKKLKYVIKPIEFEYSHGLTAFLDSIFQLKPKLKTGFTIDKFRIVIELPAQQSELEVKMALKSVDDIVDHLRNAGCSMVPVLLFSNMEMHEKYAYHLMLLKKRHLMLFYTRELGEVIKFCQMQSLCQE